MSAAAATSKRPTKGDFYVPNSLIENNGALSNAELRLALIVCRSGGIKTWKGAGKPVPVTENKWEQWTGLKPRMLDYAVKGLKEKGSLDVEGEGDKARYYFQRLNWEQFLKTRPAAVEPAKPVAPKTGAKVHPSCRERGCAMLEATACAVKTGLSLVLPASLTQNIAHDSGNPPAAAAAALPVTSGGQTGSSPAPATKVPQNIAQAAAGSVEQLFRETLEALQSFFPLVGVAFLLRLVATIKVLFADVTDSELASAVLVAGNAKKGYQKSEGLFLSSVPGALAALRKKPLPADVGPPIGERVAALLRSTGEALRVRGGPFHQLAARADQLAAAAIVGSADLPAIDEAMQGLQVDIVRTAAESMSDGERLSVAAAVEQALSPYKGKMSAVHVQQLAQQFFERQVLENLNCPRLAAFYA